MTTVATLIFDYANPKIFQLTLNFHDFFYQYVKNQTMSLFRSRVIIDLNLAI